MAFTLFAATSRLLSIVVMFVLFSVDPVCGHIHSLMNQISSFMIEDLEFMSTQSLVKSRRTYMPEKLIFIIPTAIW